MSRENVEIVRGAFDAFPFTQERLKHGTLPIADFVAEDVIWDASDMKLPDMGDGIYRGRDGVRRFWMDWLEAWDEVSFAYELRERGPYVVALIDQKMRASGDVDFPLRHYGQVWTFDEEGRVVHWKVYWNQDEALRAAGLSE